MLKKIKKLNFYKKKKSTKTSTKVCSVEAWLESELTDAVKQAQIKKKVDR